MIELVSAIIINWFSYVLLGMGVGFLVNKLDKQGESLVPTLIASIVGALTGGFLTNLIFGFQVSLFNLSSFFISLTGALLLAIVTRILRQQSEQVVQTGPKVGPASYEYSYFSDIKKDKKNTFNFLNQLNYPISKRDLLRHVEQNGEDGSDLNLLEKLPDHIYENKEEIEKQLKRL